MSWFLWKESEGAFLAKGLLAYKVLFPLKNLLKRNFSACYLLVFKFKTTLGEERVQLVRVFCILLEGRGIGGHL